MKSIAQHIQEKLKINSQTKEELITWTDFLTVVGECTLYGRLDPLRIDDFETYKKFNNQLPILPKTGTEIIELNVTKEANVKQGILACGTFVDDEYADFDIYSIEEFLKCLPAKIAEEYFESLYEEFLNRSKEVL